MEKSEEMKKLEEKFLDNSDGFWTKLFDRLVRLPSNKIYEDKVYEWKLNAKQ